MLKHSEERELLDALTFPPELQWLRMVYETKLQQYDHTANANVLEQLTHFEKEYALGGNLDLLAGVASHHYYSNDFRYAHTQCHIA